MDPLRQFGHNRWVRFILIAALGFGVVSGCASDSSSGQPNAPMQNDGTVTSTTGPRNADCEIQAVAVNGTNFSVTIKSPDTGCDQYADWWEVLDSSGNLIYRRILAHSHVSEQPFTRSGGPANVAPDQEVIVRTHMNNSGYCTSAMRGSASGGFTKTVLAQDFASAVESQSPQPSPCAF